MSVPVVKLFVPKFGREVTLNAADEARFRAEYGAYAVGEEPVPAPAVGGESATRKPRGKRDGEEV